MGGGTFTCTKDYWGTGKLSCLEVRGPRRPPLTACLPTGQHPRPLLSSTAMLCLLWKLWSHHLHCIKNVLRLRRSRDAKIKNTWHTSRAQQETWFTQPAVGQGFGCKTSRTQEMAGERSDSQEECLMFLCS